MSIQQLHDGCNWSCYNNRYASLSGLGGDFEKLRNDYLTVGKAAGRNCKCDEPSLPITFTVSTCGAESLAISAAGSAA